MQTEKEYFSAREVRGLRCESVGEYSLPDYNGDVKKVLAVKTKIFPSGKFVGEESLEFSGSVVYDVVYVDAEGAITHAEFTTDYDAAIRINAESYVDSDVSTSVASCNVRLVGPRKFSVKCVLDSDVAISEKRVHRINGDAFMEYEPEYLSRTARVLAMTFGTSEPRDIDEEMVSLDGAIADEVQILLVDAAASVDTLDKTDRGVTVKGDIRIDMLYRNGDNAAVHTVRTIPYSDTVDMSDAADFEHLSPRVEMVNLKGVLTPTDDGVRLSATATAVAKISATRNSSLALVSDAYLKERGTENEYADFNYTEHVCAESCEIRVDASVGLSEVDAEGVEEIVYADAVARIDSCEAHGSSAKIKGEVRFSGIAYHTNEDNFTNYLPVKFSALFEENVNLGCQITDDMHIDCHINVEDAVMKIDANRIDASATLCVSVSVNANKRSRCLGASYITDEEYTKDACVVTVYYPDSSESLFGIAKKFHTSIRSIAESNHLTEAVFSSMTDSLGGLGVDKLLIK